MGKEKEHLYLAAMRYGIEKFVSHQADDFSAEGIRKEDAKGFDEIMSKAFLLASATNINKVDDGRNIQRLIPITATIDNGKDAEKWHQPLSVCH